MKLKELRLAVINLLDDDHGVNSKGHDGLIAICENFGWNDITSATELQEDRAFLDDEDAEELRKVENPLDDMLVKNL